MTMPIFCILLIGLPRKEAFFRNDFYSILYKHFRSDFMLLPFQAVECYLDGIYVYQGKFSKNRHKCGPGYRNFFFSSCLFLPKQMEFNKNKQVWKCLMPQVIDQKSATKSNVF